MLSHWGKVCMDYLVNEVGKLDTLKKKYYLDPCLRSYTTIFMWIGVKYVFLRI